MQTATPSAAFEISSVVPPANRTDPLIHLCAQVSFKDENPPLSQYWTSCSSSTANTQLKGRKLHDMERGTSSELREPADVTDHQHKEKGGQQRTGERSYKTRTWSSKMAEETLYTEVQSDARWEKQSWLHTQNSALGADLDHRGETPGDPDSSAPNSSPRKPKPICPTGTWEPKSWSRKKKKISR